MVHELVTDQGVLRIGEDGVLELFRDLDGRSANRVLVWGCEVSLTDQAPSERLDGADARPGDAASAPGNAPEVTLTVTRKRLPVISVRVPRSERVDAEALAAAIRDHTGLG